MRKGGAGSYAIALLYEIKEQDILPCSDVCCTANLDATAKKSIKSRDLELWRRFYVQPK